MNISKMPWKNALPFLCLDTKETKSQDEKMLHPAMKFS